MVKSLKWVVVLLVLAFSGIQLLGPAPTNPPVEPSRTIRAHAAMPDEVARLLERSCYDCHSNETRWPWYGHVAPASWIVVDDVEEGRARMNFSEWDAYEPADAEALLTFVKWTVETRSMPPRTYTLAHPSTKLTGEEIARITAWVDAELARHRPRRPGG